MIIFFRDPKSAFETASRAVDQVGHVKPVPQSGRLHAAAGELLTELTAAKVESRRSAFWAPQFGQLTEEASAPMACKVSKPSPHSRHRYS